MLKIADAVLEILTSSDLALESMRANLLNFSEYANQIHVQVEKRVLKPVKKTTIVVALSRIAKNLDGVPTLKPVIHFDEMSIKSPLCDITFEKDLVNLERVRTLAQHISQAKFLTLTEGINEVTIIASEDMKARILEHLKEKPKAIFHDLVGVSLKFSEKYITEPNTIYGILAILAGKRINLLEIVSTYTELTIIVSRDDLEKTVQAFHNFL